MPNVISSQNFILLSGKFSISHLIFLFGLKIFWTYKAVIDLISQDFSDPDQLLQLAIAIPFGNKNYVGKFGTWSKYMERNENRQGISEKKKPQQNPLFIS